MRQLISRGSFVSALVAVALLAGAAQANAAAIYLNSTNMTVALGPTMPTTPPNGPFENLNIAASLANVINLPTAASGELHISPTTHVWVNNVPSLELVFDFGIEYNLTTVHFWNYHSEAFDVDTVSFTFFNAAAANVGTLSFSPALGNATGNDNDPIFAQNVNLAFPTNVQKVAAVLTGTNGQVDFNNIGFTGELSDPTPVPEPSTMGLLTIALAFAARGRFARRRSDNI